MSSQGTSCSNPKTEPDARCEAFLLDPRCREAIDLSPDEVLEATAMGGVLGTEGFFVCFFFLLRGCPKTQADNSPQGECHFFFGEEWNGRIHELVDQWFFWGAVGTRPSILG